MKNRTKIDESSKRDDGYEMGYFNNDLFWLDESIQDELPLLAYAESKVKENTLDFYLFYKGGCNPNVNAFDLRTDLKRCTSKNLENFDYWQACLLAFEYIESALNALNYLYGKNVKDVKIYFHDIEELINILPYNIQKELSINIGALPYDYLTTAFGPNNINVDKNGDIRKKLTQEFLEKGHFYFKKYLRRICNGSIDLRYSDVSNLKDDYNLSFLLEMCKNLSDRLSREFEPIRHEIELHDGNVATYFSQINDYDLGFVPPNESKPEINIPLQPLTIAQLCKTKQSVDAKYKALKYYLISFNKHSYVSKNVKDNNIDENSTMDSIIYNSGLYRNEVSKKSGDGEVYENYSYYQGCHLASTYIEHALKYILLKSKGETYNNLKEQYGHNLKKLFDNLNQDDKNLIKNNCMSLGEKYLFRASSKRHTNDKMVLDSDKNCDKISDESLFDLMIDLMSESFLETRYPHAENYNMEWKYSLRFMLKYADALNSLIQNKYNIRENEISDLSR